jgi:hypothetical protein
MIFFCKLDLGNYFNYMRSIHTNKHKINILKKICHYYILLQKGTQMQ